MNYLRIATDKVNQALVPADFSSVELTANVNPASLAAIVVSADSAAAAVATQLKTESGLTDLPVIINEGRAQADLRAEIARAATAYQAKVLPAFLRDLVAFSEQRPLSFTTPGHHNGKYLAKYPAGWVLANFYGENFLASDTSDTVPALGDMMMHMGSPLAAQQMAAKAFNADKVYFCTNGTTSANTICASALLQPGDVVLFDRNNHKSLYNAVLVQQQAKPVYLATDRNPLGLIGGLQAGRIDRQQLIDAAVAANPAVAHRKRPFRLAVLQTETYDGVVTDPKWLLEQLGDLCDYILFDCAWGGYEQFVPLLRKLSPLQLQLTADDPGILVTQSVHKQQAGFAQTSQILKKDSHIKGQKRYVDHKRFNHAYLKFVTTSYSYPVYASLVANAAIAQSPANEQQWQQALRRSISAMQRLAKEAHYFKPLAAPALQTQSQTELATKLDAWRLTPETTWHGFKRMAANEAILDPLKFTVQTPGVDVETGQYAPTGIPAAVVHEFMLERNIVPAKSDLNSLLFLVTPGDSTTDLDELVDAFLEFERLYAADAPLKQALPQVAKRYAKRYAGYTLQQLCHELHTFYAKNHTWQMQQALFAKEKMQDYPMTAAAADRAFMQGEMELVPLKDVCGRIALQGALPYPPGIFIVAPGERWTHLDQQYFTVLLHAAQQYPGFDPEIQGVYVTGDDRLCQVAVMPE